MTLQLGVWNFRTLNDQGDGVVKLEQLGQDLDRYKVDIVLSCNPETKRKGCGRIFTRPAIS